jgi:hypothetical protein
MAAVKRGVDPDGAFVRDWKDPLAQPVSWDAGAGTLNEQNMLPTVVRWLEVRATCWSADIHMVNPSIHPSARGAHAAAGMLAEPRAIHNTARQLCHASHALVLLPVRLRTG